MVKRQLKTRPEYDGRLPDLLFIEQTLRQRASFLGAKHREQLAHFEELVALERRVHKVAGKNKPQEHAAALLAFLAQYEYCLLKLERREDKVSTPILLEESSVPWSRSTLTI